MLDIKFIRENADIVKDAALKKKVEVDIDMLIKLDDERREVMTEVEKERSEQNQFNKKIIGASSHEERLKMISKMQELKSKIQTKEEKLKEVTKKWFILMMKVPNIPSPDTPIGPDESGNKIIREWGEKPKFDFTPKTHGDLGKELGIINIEKAAEVSGSRFSYILGDLVLLQIGLLNFVFRFLTNEETLKTIAKEANLEVSTKPFIPVLPPIMMKSTVMNKMGRLQPIDERYYFEKDDMVFIGSAEHTLGPLHMGEILQEDDLPKRYVGYSVALRREAGTYGKDMKGILRQHQFDKIEMETFSLPENSYKEQDFIVAIQEHILKQLKIPHQTVMICTGDMGGPDHRQIDIESWMPGQGAYKETHTSDLMQGFQARRLNTRVKRKNGEIEHVHMNDATAVAMGRTLIAIIENYQQPDGSIVIPEVLRPYMGGKEKISKK
ncbi:MAG: serine--tRNA ligase [Candidatus Zambryskibacteria bacterium CG10_big_fil_rev_8_21_14_0_10_34_34]|uniref:Serine--tRNA ligase n=1 Tax=Candidatus Zambryskibacteria bacterium CG10_big_fil_rev_8_21_14_0_10_34_34 TaxID=1975114 RepID=A0A2H0R2Q3_9BACT|nr:MAG: serine--tRNA ligase [Candidatus Zambryskibacteria bacterium CG10_big_fil_rev_8_21_14_0_10_34_34]